MPIQQLEKLLKKQLRRTLDLGSTVAVSTKDHPKQEKSIHVIGGFTGTVFAVLLDESWMSTVEKTRIELGQNALGSYTTVNIKYFNISISPYICIREFIGPRSRSNEQTMLS